MRCLGCCRSQYVAGISLCGHLNPVWRSPQPTCLQLHLVSVLESGLPNDVVGESAADSSPDCKPDPVALQKTQARGGGGGQGWEEKEGVTGQAGRRSPCSRQGLREFFACFINTHAWQPTHESLPLTDLSPSPLAGPSGQVQERGAGSGAEERQDDDSGFLRWRLR